jgi:hypothetical protein
LDLPSALVNPISVTEIEFNSALTREPSSPIIVTSLDRGFGDWAAAQGVIKIMLKQKAMPPGVLIFQSLSSWYAVPLPQSLKSV